MTESVFIPMEDKKAVFKDGSYDLSGKNNYYWGEISQDEARLLLSLARKSGYLRAAAKFGIKYPGFYEYMVSYLRGDWLFDCIDFSKRGRCLDIGSGWGAITFALSYQFDEVWSLEAVKERLEFQKIRAEQEKRNNIKFVRSDWLRLPFVDNSFDIVCANGVLEWVGLSDFSQNPQKLQLLFLKEVKRVLKPGGCLYIGIENRYALFLLLGAKDHSGLPFTSLLPRKLADVIVRSFRDKEKKYAQEKRVGNSWSDYRTYTHSLWGYKKLLRETGFSDTEINWTISYNAPAETGKFDKESFLFLLNLYREHNFNVTVISKLATALGSRIPASLMNVFFPLVAPNFLIYAHKGGERGQRFSEKIFKLKQGITSYIRRSGTHGLSSKVNFILLKDGKPQTVIKLARFRQFSKALEKEIELSANWNRTKVEKKIIDSREVFIEPYFKGKICQTNSTSDNKRAIEWLINFHRKSLNGFWKDNEFTGRVRKYLKVLSEVNLPDNTQRYLTNMVNNFLTKSKDMKIPRVSEHGDFVKTNIIFANGRTYVLDWEFYEEKGDPFFDFIFFLVNNSIAGKMPECFEENFTGEGDYSSKIKILMRLFSKKTNLPTTFIFESIPYVLMRALYRRFEDRTLRHLDIVTFTELLKAWNNIYQKSKSWFLEV